MPGGKNQNDAENPTHVDHGGRAFVTGYGFDRQISRGGSRKSGQKKPNLPVTFIPTAVTAAAIDTSAGDTKFTKLPLTVSGEVGHYEGDVSSKTGLPEGDGSFRCANGFTYVGGWSNGLPFGHGIRYDANGTETDGTWEAGVVTSVSHTRTLKERFKNGPMERIAYFKSVGYTLFEPYSQNYAWGSLGYAIVLILSVIASVNFKLTKPSKWVLPVAVSLFLQIAIWIWLALHWWMYATPSATLRSLAVNAVIMLIPITFVYMGATLNSDVWGELVTGYEMWFYGICTCVVAFVYGLCFVWCFYIGLPGSIKDRKEKAKAAFDDGMWDGYVDMWANLTRPVVCDILLGVGGGSMVAWEIMCIISGPEVDERLDNTTLNTFYPLHYYGLAQAITCLFGGVSLAVMRVFPYFNRANPGEVSLKDLYAPTVSYIPCQLACCIFNVKCAVCFFGFGRSLTELKAVGIWMILYGVWLALVMGLMNWGRWIAGLKRPGLFVNDDAKIYDGIWKDLFLQTETDVAELARVCDGLSTPNGHPEQPLEKKSAFKNFLDLFRRAKLLDPHVQKKSTLWASSAAEQDIPSAGGPTSAKPIRAPVKTHERAIQKVWRSYSGQVAPLMDLSRACIVCNSVPQLVHILKCIDQDEDVTLLRYKNRLNPEYDSSKSGGYRDLSLNLKFTDHYEANVSKNDEERWGGMVFEVQLIIKAMFDVKTAEGHSNYRKFRDLAVA